MGSNFACGEYIGRSLMWLQWVLELWRTLSQSRVPRFLMISLFFSREISNEFHFTHNDILKSKSSIFNVETLFEFTIFRFVLWQKDNFPRFQFKKSNFSLTICFHEWKDRDRETPCCIAYIVKGYSWNLSPRIRKARRRNLWSLFEVWC